LTEQQFRFLLGYDCCVEGFHPSGFTAVLEHGTTAIREPVERQIKAIPGFGKLITLACSGILSEAVHAGLFAGCGGGNFRMKALCESMHNVLHNRTAHLLGNRGRDAERMHESRGALVRYEERLMVAAEKLDARTRDAIRFELATWSEYVAAFRVIEHELMDDWQHTLEGWDGREVTEFRFSETSNDWQPVEALLADGERVEAVSAWLKSRPECVRVRPLSRREMWTAGKKDLIQVQLMEMPAFLADSDAIELKVRDNGTIGFSNQLYYGRDEVIYRLDKLRTPAGFSARVAPRQNVWVKFNPLVPNWVYLLDKDSGATLGMAPILNRAPTYDKHAVEVAMGEQAADLARKLFPVRGRHQIEAEERVARVAHNQRVLVSAPPLRASAPIKPTGPSTRLSEFMEVPEAAPPPDAEPVAVAPAERLSFSDFL